jgi:hypothetical protein
MAQENFNVSQPNDGLGDKLRAAFIKVQSNFTDLFTEKVDKEVGKGLSANDYTTTEKNKLANIEDFAELNVQSDFLQNDDTQDDFIKNKPAIPVVADYLLNGGYAGTAQDLDDAIEAGGQLVKVTENGKTGYRLKDADPANYGDIGHNAVDLSFQIDESTTNGATGNNSHAQGADTTASGDISHAEGELTTASGNNSHAEGNGTNASGNNSHTEGNNTAASADESHAEGNATTASGQASHAEGISTKASGQASHAEGNETTASGASSHAEGNGTTASGQASHAEGELTVASGQVSRASGTETVASGNFSDASGNSTTASGNVSKSLGFGTFARSLAEFCGGIFPTDYTPQSATNFDLTDRLVNYGNGLDTSNRSDAYTLFKNGMQKFFTAALNTITNAVKGSVMLDENARLNIHDGTAFKAVPFTSEVATAAQGVTADNSVQLTGAQTVAGVKTFSNNIIANGNVGIGTSFINAKLTVEGTGFFGNNVYNLSQSRDLFISGGRRDPGDAAGFLLRSAQVANVGSTFNILVANGVSGGGANYGQYTDGASRLFIATNGNVSIGNTNPTERLDVVGNGKFSGTVTAGSDINANGLTVGRGGGNISTNTATGQNALQNNTTGNGNTAIGTSALFTNTTGTLNTATGINCLLFNLSGTANTASGRNAMQSNTTGNDSTGIGVNALFSNTTGGTNNAFGFNALQQNTTGSGNTGVGISAGRFVSGGGNAQTCSNSVYIGNDTRALADGQTNQVVIGHNAVGAGSNTVTLGHTTITNTILRGAVSFAQFTTATEPAYLKGAQFFNTTLNKMRIGGATAYETVTSS